MIPDHLLPQTALDWYQAGRKVAVAMVVETWGSAPRTAGSWMVIDDSGAMEGSVSGGCVEGAVVAEAQAAITDGQSRLLDYGVSDDNAFAVGLACGGRIRILIDVVGHSMPVSLLMQLAQEHPIAYVADLHSDARATAQPDAFPDRFRFDRSGVEDDDTTYVGIHNPALRMIIVGAVHIAQTLCITARACGFVPIVIDPREAFSSSERFPNTTILSEWPDEAITALAPDPRTAIITLAHDPKLDDPAIITALASDAFYLGCLGSKRTHAKRVARLKSAGLSDSDIAHIHAPVGLNIGSQGPAEIAISIMAEVIQTLRKTP
jgi:xanthine dehydrogenase accessory factor